MLSHFSWLKVPKIYWSLSTDRVLTMEYCSGGFIDDVQYMKDNKIDLVGVSNKISQVISKMCFVPKANSLKLKILFPVQARSSQRVISQNNLINFSIWLASVNTHE